MKYKNQIDLACIGSIVLDLIFSDIEDFIHIGKLTLADQIDFHLGGCAVNTSLAFKKLGGDVRLIGRVGNDYISQILLQELQKIEVLTNSIIQSPSKTAITVVIVSSDGERTFLYYPGANKLLSKADINVDALLSSRIVHFSDTFLLPNLDGTGTYELLQLVKSSGSFTSMDISWDPKGRWLSLIHNYLPLIDFFFCNKIEAQSLTGYEDAFNASQFLLDCGVGTVIIKMGERGSLIRKKHLLLEIPSIKVEVKDSTGSGDCYVAAFLLGILRGWDYESIGLFASAAGAASVTQVGATTGIHSFDNVCYLLTTHSNTIFKYA